jgi:hypothetical protein
VRNDSSGIRCAKNPSDTGSLSPNERRTLGHNKQGQDEHPKVIADGPDSGRRSIRTERQEELVIILSARKYPQPTLFSFYLWHQSIMMI